MPAIIAQVTFSGDVIEWRGPAPYLFVAVPPEHVAELRYAARQASYGWGCVPTRARIGETNFSTSLFPREDTYLLPIKVAVQRAESITFGDRVAAAIEILRP